MKVLKRVAKLPAKAPIEPQKDEWTYCVSPFALDPDKSFPTTYAVYDRKTKEYIQMITVTSQGLHLGWSQCKDCSLMVPDCVCSKGAGVSSAIEHIYNSDLARANGEQWDHTHRNYKGTLRKQPTNTHKKLVRPVPTPAEVVPMEDHGEVDQAVIDQKAKTDSKRLQKQVKKMLKPQSKKLLKR